MPKISGGPIAQRARVVSRVCGGAVLAISVAVLAGSAFDVPLLRSGFIGGQIVGPNASGMDWLMLNRTPPEGA
jgi:hypothetical protein